MSESAGHPNVIYARAPTTLAPTAVLADATAQALYVGNWVWDDVNLIWIKKTHYDQSHLYGYNGTNWQNVRLDQSTRSLQTIDYAHHEVHAGSAFWAYKSAVLGNGEVSTVGFVTPDTTKWAHLLLRIDLTAVATLDILEDVTSFAGGAAFTELNFNRNSGTASTMTVTTGHTGSDLITPTGGTEIWNEILGTRGQQTSRQNASELILKQDSNYLFRITNSTVANSTTILLTWYEHTDKAA